MAITQEIVKSGARTIPGGGFGVTALAAGAAGIAASGRGDKEYERGFFRVVNEGEVGIRTHMGKPRYTKETAKLPQDERRARIAYPAGHPRIGFPFLRPLRIVSIQDRALNLGSMIVDKEDDVQYRVDASVIWGITPELAERSVFRTNTLVLNVGEICQNGLRRALQQTAARDITDPQLTESLIEIMHAECDTKLQNYGSDLRGLNIASYAKTEAQMNKEALAQLVAVQHTPTPTTTVAAVNGIQAINGDASLSD